MRRSDRCYSIEDECNCQCHYNDCCVHCAPCCYQCEYCKINIPTYIYEDHNEKCKEKNKNVN